MDPALDETRLGAFAAQRVFKHGERAGDAEHRFGHDECDGGKVDSAELLSAVGTFLAALAAFVSVGVIVLRENPHIYWTMMIMLGWVIGVMMQIIAGAIARTRT